MNLISTEEKIELLKNLLADPDDWISREILFLIYRSEEDQQQRSVASLPKAITGIQISPIETQ